MTRLAYLWNPLAVDYLAAGTTSGSPSYDETQKITKTVGVQLLSYNVRSLAEIEKAFADMAKVRPQALLVLQSPVMTLNSKRIVELALEQHLPGMYPSNQFAQEGGLMAYGPLIADLIGGQPPMSIKSSKVATPPNFRSSSQPSSSY